MSVFLIVVIIFLVILYTIAILLVPVFIWRIHTRVTEIRDLLNAPTT